MRRKLKIAILEPRLNGIGGSKKAIGQIAEYLESKGHIVEFFTQRYIEGKSYPEFKNKKINFLKPKSKIFLPLIFLFKKIKGFDLLILNTSPANLSSIRNNSTITICYSPSREIFDLRKYLFKNSGFKNKIKIILKNILLKKFEIIAAKKTNKILVISKNVQKRVRKYYEKNSDIFYIGFNPKEFYCKDYKDYILSISRFVNAKRVDILIKSMDFVKNKKIKLIVVGGGDENKKIAKMCKERENVELVGEVNSKELSKLYSHCLAVAYIPIDEDWGLIPLEAGASNKCTIGVNEGGLKETIIEGKTGFLLNSVNPKKIAEKIDLLANNKNLAKKMGTNAKQYVKKFEWEKTLPIIEKAIEKNVEKK